MSSETPKRFPVLLPFHVRRRLMSYMIPWAMIAPHEAQAVRNHGGQSLQRLAERGGLDPSEILAVLDDRPWRRIEFDEGFNEIEHRVAAWREAQR